MTGDADNLISVDLVLQRLGSPTGEVAIEIWDDAGANVPSSLVATVGSFEVASLSSDEPEIVSLEANVTGLQPNSPYYVVFNNNGTDINSLLANNFFASTETVAAAYDESYALSWQSDGYHNQHLRVGNESIPQQNVVKSSAYWSSYFVTPT